MKPIRIPERWAKLAIPEGTNIPIISPIIQKIEASHRGRIRPKARTPIFGLNIVRQPIIPNMAPEAPSEEG